jgi:hypothetical protein
MKFGGALSEMAANSYRDIPARRLKEFRALQGTCAQLDSVVSWNRWRQDWPHAVRTEVARFVEGEDGLGAADSSTAS